MTAALIVTPTEDARLIGAARALADTVDLLVLDGVAESAAACVAGLAPTYAAVLGPANVFGRDVLARAAALCGAPMASDVVAIASRDIFVRPTHTDRVHAMVQLGARPMFVTVRPAAFAPAANIPRRLATPAPAPWTRTRRIRAADAGAGGRADLGTARIVLGAGRGVATPAAMAAVERLAATLGAALGATRPVVDAGLAPEALLLGQSGKVVAPDLYLALGISGALQHLAGVRDAKVIAAINSDPSAPIFESADVGWVADLGLALPELDAALQAKP